jgi:hypothetical protein
LGTAPLIRYIDRNVVFATLDRALLQVWRGEATPEGVQKLLEVGRALVAKEGHGGKQACSSLSVVESASPAPNERVRPLLSACYRELAAGMQYQLFVPEGSGFRSAMVRGVGLAVSTFAPSLLPFKFASNVAEAAALIAPTLSLEFRSAPLLVNAVESARRALDDLSPR